MNLTKADLTKTKGDLRLLLYKMDEKQINYMVNTINKVIKSIILKKGKVASGNLLNNTYIFYDKRHIALVLEAPLYIEKVSESGKPISFTSKSEIKQWIINKNKFLSSTMQKGGVRKGLYYIRPKSKEDSSGLKYTRMSNSRAAKMLAPKFKNFKSKGSRITLQGIKKYTEKSKDEDYNSPVYSFVGKLTLLDEIYEAVENTVYNYSNEIFSKLYQDFLNNKSGKQDPLDLLITNLNRYAFLFDKVLRVEDIAHLSIANKDLNKYVRRVKAYSMRNIKYYNRTNSKVQSIMNKLSSENTKGSDFAKAANELKVLFKGKL